MLQNIPKDKENFKFYAQKPVNYLIIIHAEDLNLPLPITVPHNLKGQHVYKRYK